MKEFFGSLWDSLAATIPGSVQQLVKTNPIKVSNDITCVKKEVNVAGYVIGSKKWKKYGESNRTLRYSLKIDCYDSTIEGYLLWIYKTIPAEISFNVGSFMKRNEFIDFCMKLLDFKIKENIMAVDKLIFKPGKVVDYIPPIYSILLMGDDRSGGYHPYKLTLEEDLRYAMDIESSSLLPEEKERERMYGITLKLDILEGFQVGIWKDPCSLENTFVEELSVVMDGNSLSKQSS